MSFKPQRTLTAILFLAVLLAGICYLAAGFHEALFLPGLGFRNAAKPAVEEQQQPQTSPVEETGPFSLLSLSEEIIAATEAVEQSLTDTLDRDRAFIESYGLVQRLMGRRVMEDVDPQYTVARLSNDALTFADPDAAYSDPNRRARALAEFRDRLAAKRDIPLLYVQAPQKASSYAEARLPSGLSEYGDRYADDLLAALDSEGIDTLDLRPVFSHTGRYDELFFRTDHHWTTEGAFLAWQAVAEVLEADYGFSIDTHATDPGQWEVEVLEDVFLGSQGKRVGALYAGADDFELWSPQKSGEFQYLVPIEGYDRAGSFATSLLFPERLEETDPYKANPYTYYSGGDYSFARMKNLENPDGPTVVLIRDSFACPFAPFMAAGVGEVVTIDLRYFHEDLLTYISWVEADMVLFLYSPSSVKLDAMFRFTPPMELSLERIQAIRPADWDWAHRFALFSPPE